MANDLSLPASFGKAPAAYAAGVSSNDDLGAGVSSSYGVLGYRGKVWAVKFGGVETPLMRDDGDGPRNSIEVVIVKSSPAISKIYYKSGYVDGSNAAPDCWSGSGVAPDTSVQNKVSATCANCPMNAWGSRTTDAGKQAKACADSRRTAVVPLNDFDNELAGGPMLLRVPAASLKDLKAYGDLLKSYQYPYYAAATRVSFDPAEAFPKFVLQAIRPLTEDEAKRILEIRESQQVKAVLAERLDGTGGAVPEAAKEVPSSPFEQDAPVTAAGNQQATQTAPKAAPKAAAKPTAKAEAAPANDKLAAAKAALEQAQKEAAAEEAARLEAEAAAKKAARPKTAAEKLAEAQAELSRLAAMVEAEEAAPKSSVSALLAGGSDEDELGGESQDGDNAAPTQFDDMLEGILDS